MTTSGSASVTHRAFVMMPFESVEAANAYAASHPERPALVTLGDCRSYCDESGGSGTELVLEGWRPKFAGDGTVVLTDRWQRRSAADLGPVRYPEQPSDC